MAITDRQVSNLIMNVLTRAQYDGIASPNADELYFITDDKINVSNLTGTLPVANGGTGATSVADALTNLGISATTSSVTVNGTTFNKYTHPTYTSKTSGLYKITVDGTGHVSGTAAVAKGDIPALDYLPLAGGTMTGVLKAYANQYTDNYTTCGIDMQNSDIVGLNSIYTADSADNAGEGIHFYRDSTHVDTLWMNGGDILFAPNRALGTGTTKANSQKVARFTANPTTGQVVVTDGTTGGVKTTGYTIAKSVPSDAVFTDNNYYHTTGSWSGLTYTATANGGAGALAFTIPTGTTSTTIALGNHTHTTSLASGGTATVNLAANTAYTLTAGGTSVIFKTPADADTKNTAGSTDTSSKIFLIGATSQAANPQTYSDDQVYVTSGTLQANVVSATAGVNANTANSGTAGGVSLYNTNPANYGLTMRQTGTSTGQLGKHGYVQGDWAGYLCFTGDTNRGYIFRQAGNNVASISGLGHAVFNGSVTVGGNAANTAGCKMEFNATTNSLDFIFA